MKIVFFDGHCSLCNGFVDTLIKIDKNKKLKFASLQGETAASLLGRTQTSIEDDTVIFLNGRERFERSTAVLKILYELGGLWSLSKILLLVPVFARDFVYDLVARNRYSFIKRNEVCRKPNQNEIDRILF